MRKQLLPFLAACAFTTTAQAATFQYIFNNVEQGQGGVSSPSISVDGQKVRKNGAPASADSLASIPTESSIASSQETVDNTPTYHHRFRFLAAGARISHSRGSDWSSTRNDFRGMKELDGGISASLAATVWASRDIGFTGFWIAPGATGANGKQVIGAEMEFIPVRVAVLGNDDLFEIGALLGGSTLGRDLLNKAGTLHLGGRLNVNFHEQLGITGALRTNFTDRRFYRYAQADIGLAYRF